MAINKMTHWGRKFWAFIISLVTLVACAAFGIDVTLGTTTLFGLYVGSNVAQKATKKIEEK